MSLISAKTGQNLFHYSLIGTSIILTYDSRTSILYNIHETTGAILKMRPVNKISYEEFIDMSKKTLLTVVSLSN